MEMMESRREQLSQLRDFIKEADNEVTLILQTLQWDKDTLMQEIKADPMVTCEYDSNHRIPLKTRKEHEHKCFLKSQGYDLDDTFLPEPLDPDAKTLIKLTSDDIKQIIDGASKNDPLFKKGNGSVESEPLTWDRMVVTYTRDERRAMYDAVVNAMPFAHDLSDLALAGSSGGTSEGKAKSRLEVLAELRDMKRRRARYRGVAPNKNYSHTLRELIATQMELYTGSNVDTEIEQSKHKATKVHHTQRQYDEYTQKEKYIKERVREDLNLRESKRDKDREHYIQDSKEKYKHTDGSYSKKRERDSSTYSERDRKYSRHGDRKRYEKYDTYRDDRDNISRDRKRQHEEDRQRHRERKEDKYRRSEKAEYTRYYDNYEKSRRRASKEKTSSKEHR